MKEASTSFTKLNKDRRTTRYLYSKQNTCSHYRFLKYWNAVGNSYGWNATGICPLTLILTRLRLEKEVSSIADHVITKQQQCGTFIELPGHAQLQYTDLMRWQTFFPFRLRKPPLSPTCHPPKDRPTSTNMKEGSFYDTHV